MRNPRFPDGRRAAEASAMSAPTRRAAAGAIASWAGLAAIAGLVPTPGAAQVAYPVRSVRIVVPFAPGGGADLIARMLTPHLQQRLEQSFFVDNRAGAAGRIGAGAVAKADPDGHTLLMTTESSIVIAPHMACP
jgi:tripartite-type tricarboxylate transporter receptor subunit TctC